MKDRPNPTLRPVTLLAIGLLLCAASALAAKPVPRPSKPSAPSGLLVKCIDGKGRVHYSDRPGGDCESSSRLTKQGVTVDTPPAPQPKAHAKKSKGQSAEQTRYDKALLATYTNEAEIEEARARNLELPRQAVKLAETHVERARAQLGELNKQAKQHSSQGKPAPAMLLEDIQAKQAEVARLENDLADKQAHADEVGAKFDADLRRFRELTASVATR